MIITATLRDETGEHALATRDIEGSQAFGDFMKEAVERLTRNITAGERRAVSVVVVVLG